MDPRLLQLIRENVDSFVKWDLLKFFRDHPEQPEPAKRMAGYCGRKLDTVERAAEEMAQAGYLVQQRGDGQIRYSLTEDPDQQEIVSLFLSSSDEPSLRVRIIAEVLRMQEDPLPTPVQQPGLPVVDF